MRRWLIGLTILIIFILVGLFIYKQYNLDNDVEDNLAGSEENIDTIIENSNDEEDSGEDIQNKQEDTIVDRNTDEKIKETVIKPKEGYTTYIVEYVSTDNSPIQMANELKFIRGKDIIYNSIEDAEKDKVILDYNEWDNKVLFRIKKGYSIVFKVNPYTTSSIPDWNEDKADLPISLYPIDENIIIKNTFILDYSKSGVGISLDGKVMDSYSVDRELVLSD